MDVHVILPASAFAIQVASIFLVLRLWRQTGSHAISLVLLAIVTLMASRRGLSLLRFFGDGEFFVDQTAEAVAVTISCLIVFAILYIGRMISRERASQDSLVSAEARYRTLFNQSPDGVLLIDARGIIVEFNDETCRQLGYTRQEFEKVRIADLDPVESPEQIRLTFEQVAREGKAEFEVKHKTKGGEIRDVFVITQTVQLGGERFYHTIWRDITERKRTEELLKQSEERLRLAIAANRQGWYELNIRTGEIMVSDEYARILGYEPSQFSTNLQDWMNGLEPDDRAAVQDSLQEATETGGIRLMEFRRRTKTGDSKWIRATGKVVELDADRRPVRVIGTLTDISDQKQAEHALFESESRLRLFIRHAPAALAMFDRNMRFLAASRRWFIDYALKDEDIIGRSLYQIIPDIPELWKTSYQRGLAGEVVQGEEELFRRADGSNRWIKWELRPWFDASGGVGGIVVFTEDITDQREAEEKIRRSEQFIRGMLDTVDEGFIVVDREYRIQTANRAYCEQMGADCGSIIGKTCYEVSHKTARPCHETGEDCAPRRVFETGKPYSAVHRHQDQKGGIMFVETKAFPIPDASGAVGSVIETITNITERHLLEEERLKTQKLESIGTLAGGIAHDFNNLLQGVFGYLSMAKMTLGEKAKAQSMLEQAEKALHQSVNLTTQLLTFSKGGKPVMKTTQLGPVIENSVKFALSGSRSTYDLRIASDLWQVQADPGQLGQVIQNIVLNADQAMPNGGRIVIAARNLAASDPALPHELNGRDSVELAIQDNGVGIPDANLSKIFDPYFTTKEKGTGLGLATTYSIMRNHGGVVRVKSAVNAGSVFSICLPASIKSTEEHANRAVPPRRRAGRVLVMDDEEVIRMVAEEMLTALGQEVAVADKGETAIEAFRKAREENRPFDVVILDLTIRGGMGGADTLKKLLSIDPDVRAVVSSGYSDDAIASRYHEQGFKAFLKKPYNVDELQEVINTLLN